ncbi:phage major capsid protein, P2 family [Verminephrobacter aporrectodeae subsp. tuberculatae]|uniref:phage major capsid protein, P2 family n=1 Tax=Verminephrobacter aporrectodeae TaxID=1110389 RepID=UPI002242CC12|nr:phage major capsid protein, P2 family [Verminephrobacter aporrectodeae]MCW8207622.1 phage major capsid protein, P2 family [Verminephrobacter aporrectodeae subsp. tuberculatae]
MRNETRQAYIELLNQLGRLNTVADASKQFTVAPSIQQKLESKIQESSDFLSKINISPVIEMQGAKLGLGVSGPVAGRTNTDSADRQTKDLSTLDSKGYQCVQTNFDTHIKYSKLDAWAKFPDFQTRVRDAIVRRQALDRILIGFSGTSVAANTDLTANPLLQDVNKGWLQHLREDAPARVMDHGATAGVVKIGTGTGTDYKNLDAAVFDSVSLLDPWFQNDPDLVVILGRALLVDKYFPLVNVTQAPTESLAADIVISQKRIGGLAAVSVPYFPDNAMMITTFDNLSIYWQEGGRRRRVEENPKRDRIENYESSNDAYVVEDNGRAALIEHIQFVNT